MQGADGLVRFVFEHIELLWIVPVVAFGFFIFLIQLAAQHKGEQQDLSQEVSRFNNGTLTTVPQETAGSVRLNQLERAIAAVTDSLTTQQRAIEQFHRDNTAYNGEINDLKNRLRELYKEYDIVLSENYSLRAKVKKLQDRQDEEPAEIPVRDVTSGESAPSEAPPPYPPPPSPISSKVDMKLYEDTRTLNLALLDDTSEIDLADLNNRFDSR